MVPVIVRWLAASCDRSKKVPAPPPQATERRHHPSTWLVCRLLCMLEVGEVIGIGEFLLDGRVGAILTLNRYEEVEGRVLSVMHTLNIYPKCIMVVDVDDDAIKRYCDRRWTMVMAGAGDGGRFLSLTPACDCLRWLATACDVAAMVRRTQGSCDGLRRG